MCQRRNKLWVMIKIWLNLFEKKFKPINISMAARFIIKMLYGLERRFRRLQITRHSRRLPRKESTAMLPNMLENNIAFKLLSTMLLWNDVSLAFDKLFQVISLSVFFSTPISAEDAKHKPLKIFTIKKPLGQCLFKPVFAFW